MIKSVYLSKYEAINKQEQHSGEDTYINIDLIKNAMKKHAQWILDYDSEVHSKEDFKYHSGAFIVLTDILKDIK